MGTRTPSKTKRLLNKDPDTPSKRIEVLINQKEEADKLVANIHRLKMDAEEHLNILPLENEEDTVNLLSLCLSVAQMCSRQPRAREFSRQECHHKEHLQGFSTLCINKAGIFVALSANSSVLPKSDDLHKDNPADISSLLWQATWLHKEPYLAFINPPVTPQ